MKRQAGRGHGGGLSFMELISKQRGGRDYFSKENECDGKALIYILLKTARTG